MKKKVPDSRPLHLIGTSVILDGFSFLIDNLEYDEGLAIKLQVRTRESKRKIKKMYTTCIGTELSISIGDYRNVAILNSVVCSGECDMGFGLRKFNNIHSCRVVVDIPFKEYCEFICNSKGGFSC